MFHGKHVPTSLDAELLNFLNVQDKKGNTFLHELCYEEPYSESDEDFFDLIRAKNSIIDTQGLDLNARNDKGETPFLLGLKYKNVHFFKLVMNIKKHKRGFIDFECANSKGQSVLHRLALSKNVPFSAILTSTYLKKKLFIDQQFQAPSDLIPAQYFPLRKLFKRCEVKALGFNKIYENRLIQINSLDKKSKSLFSWEKSIKHDFNRSNPLKRHSHLNLITKDKAPSQASAGFQRLKELVGRNQLDIKKFLIKVYIVFDKFRYKNKKKLALGRSSSAYTFSDFQRDSDIMNRVKNWFLKFICQLCKQKHRADKNGSLRAIFHYQKDTKRDQVKNQKGGNLMYEQIIRLYGKQNHQEQHERFLGKFRLEEEEENSVLRSIICRDKLGMARFAQNEPKLGRVVRKTWALILENYLDLFDLINKIRVKKSLMFLNKSIKEALRVEFVSLVNWIIFLIEDPTVFFRTLDKPLMARLSEMIKFPKFR